MKKLSVVPALMVAGLLAASVSVQAKNICLQDDFGTYWIFKGVKSLKPGKVSALTGIYDVGGLNAAVSGSAIGTADKLVNFGFYIYSSSTNNFSVTVKGADQTLTGSGTYDNNGTMTSDGSISFTAVNCKALPSL